MKPIIWLFECFYCGEVYEVPAFAYKHRCKVRTLWQQELFKLSPKRGSV